MYIYISGLCLASQWETWLTRMEKKLSHTLCCGNRNPIWLTAVWTTHKDNGSVPFHSWFKPLLYILFLYRWIHAFVLFTSNSDRTIQLDSSLMAQAMLFQSSIIQFWWVHSEAEVSGSGVVICCCCSRSASRFNMLGIREALLHSLVLPSDYLSHCCLPISSKQFGHSPLTSDFR